MDVSKFRISKVGYENQKPYCEPQVTGTNIQKLRTPFQESHETNYYIPL